MSTPPGDQGWGKGQWGVSPWGIGFIEPPSPPVVTAISPVNGETGVAQSRPIVLSITDNEEVALASIRVAVGGINYIFGGVAQNGADVSFEVNDGNGVDIEIYLPEKMPLGSRQEVAVSVKDNDGLETNESIFFTVGVGGRLLSVVNPAPNLLIARFNEAMTHDEEFLFPGNWLIRTITEGAPDLVITKVSVDPGQANVAFLEHEGGGSTYELTVIKVSTADGDALELGQNSAVFELIYSQEEDPRISLFNTIFGPIGVSQRVRNRRTMDDHVINRSIALGMDEQFRLRFQSLDGTQGRDGRPGTRRT